LPVSLLPFSRDISRLLIDYYSSRLWNNRKLFTSPVLVFSRVFSRVLACSLETCSLQMGTWKFAEIWPHCALEMR
jgi:hypothetical protein